MHVETLGTGDATIVLLHGMGATGAVWRRVVDELRPRWQGRIVVVDLPGHGASAPLERYTYDTVTEAVRDVLPLSATTIACGHSYGGAIAVRLGASCAIALGVKVTWSAEDLAGAASVAAKGVRWFETREEALDRYRKVSGLTGDVTDDERDLARGVAEVDGRWRLGHDPLSIAIGDPAMTAAVRAARGTVLLGRGASDPMVTDAELAALGGPTFVVAGAGHNAHVERPAEVARIVLDAAR
jgi:pimeloyl-ACP methyl ester carboxylesterase